MIDDRHTIEWKVGVAFVLACFVAAAILFILTALQVKSWISTPPMPNEGTRILLIQGIGSESTCEGSTEFIDKTSWLTDALSRAPEISSGDFLYYAYRSPDTTDYTCSDKETPQYSKKDSCWSIDDVYKSGIFGEPQFVKDGGQAKRLAAYLRKYFDDKNNPRDLSIITHSQGGVLATYTVLTKLEGKYNERITAIITLDSPLLGINSPLGPDSLAAVGLRVFARCDGWGRHQRDSSFDMLPDKAVIRRITNKPIDELPLTNPPPTKLYTVNANPGEQPVGHCAGKPVCIPLPVVDNEHSDLKWWSCGQPCNDPPSENNTRHIEVGAQTHSDIWDGCFLHESSRKCAGVDGSGLVAEGERLVRFIACAVSNEPNSNCKEVADQR